MTNQPPLVTVIVATYNRANVLRYAIESVLWQTYRDFELWVIGDCCTDDTEQVVQSFMADPRVHWYNLPENSGYQSEPNNEGIRRARGRYIAYLNHDDLWLPHHLQHTVTHIEESGADIVFSVMQWVYSRGRSRPDIPLLPDLPIPPEATAVVHRKDIISTIGYWKGIHETYSYPRVDFFRRAQFKGMQFEIVPSLTALKFLWDERDYHDTGPQPVYMERLRREPDFLNRELTAMLILLEQEIHTVPIGKRLRQVLYNPLRRLLLRWKVDPAALRFWQHKGTQIKVWRRRHKLSTIAHKKKGTLGGQLAGQGSS